MELAFDIAKCVAWAPGLEDKEDWQLWQKGHKPMTEELGLPPLKTIPPMQRRRLSPFAKVTLHCALESSDYFRGDLPCVFSSRHGDLHRTTELITNVAKGEELSPTRFGLSVHNAVSGLYSIYAENRAPITAIASGEASFTAGLVDSVVKLHVHNLKQILYVYSDLVVPECYSQFVKQNISLGIGMLIKTTTPNQNEFVIQNAELTNTPLNSNQPLDFMNFYHSDRHNWRTQVNQQTWNLFRS